MPTLFPPDYPYRPDAPLLSFGPAFSEEISRSVIAAVLRPDDEHQHETEVTVAAALTMLEAFHPRDHLECMLAAQGVATHTAIMENFRRAMNPDMPIETWIKLQASSCHLIRAFSTVHHDLERRQSKPLPERPPEPPPAEPPLPKPPIPPIYDDAPDTDEEPVSLDLERRPDGTPGSLSAYAPKPPDVPYVPEEPLIMQALATRPKPYRIVNGPQAAPEADPLPPAVPDRGLNGTFPSVDLREKIIAGDALARFASARFDPDAPPPVFEDDYAEVEIEILSTGGDPEAEAERAALIAAHPEGKPVRTLIFGVAAEGDVPPDDWDSGGAPAAGAPEEDAGDMDMPDDDP